MVDVECHSCLLLQQDIWRDEINPRCPRCGVEGVVEVFRRAPVLDFHDTKPLVVDGVGGFKSVRAMDAYEKRHDRTIMTPQEWERLPVDTLEERVEKNTPSRLEAIRKTRYQLKHRHIKPAVYEPESKILWDQPKVAEAK